MITDANDILGNKYEQSATKKQLVLFNKNDTEKKVYFI